MASNKRTHLLYLSSKQGSARYVNRVDNMRFDLADMITIDKTKERGFVSLRFAQVPNTFSQIHAGNDAFLLSSPTIFAPVEIVIPHGTYTGSQLASEIRDLLLLTAFGNTVIFSFNIAAGKFKITNNRAEIVAITFDQEHSAQELLGLPPIGKLTAGNTASYCVYTANFSQVGVFGIHSSLDLNNTYSSHNKGSTNILEMFPMTGTTGEQSSYTNTNNYFRSEIRNENIANISLWFTDDEGDILEMPDSHHWMVGLLIEIEEK